MAVQGEISRFNRFGKEEDLEKVIEATERAATMPLEDSPVRTSYLGNLAKWYPYKFKLNPVDNQADLENAIKLME
ncbi:hypothetical protein TWF481_002560 [Arthrobotrys musiformis]|uniref:Uncharacterized protein n=1 Tax=Arthrobotrys musiformis TaxID=47236 RepID=A0AAV9VQN4_9PEZI